LHAGHSSSEGRLNTSSRSSFYIVNWIDVIRDKKIVGYAFKKHALFLSRVKQVTKDFSNVYLVNSYFADVEQVIDNKCIKVCTNSYFHLLFYSIVIEDKRFDFKPPFDFLQMHKGSKEERIAKLFIFSKIKSREKHKNNAFFFELKWIDYINNFNFYLEKYAKQARLILKRLEKNIIVKQAEFIDDISSCRINSNSILIYQGKCDIITSSIDSACFRYANFEFKKNKKANLKSISCEETNYLIISKSKDLAINKNFRYDRSYLYSNAHCKSLNFFKNKNLIPVYYKKIPDNYSISRKSKIKFIKAKLGEVDYLRTIYLQKNILQGAALFNYLWFIDDFLFGCCMFDFPKNKQKTLGAWMKSDFVVDSIHQKLSKLLIMAILSKEFKEELDIRYYSDISLINTNVFTNKNVSMKYRGVFNKSRKEIGKISYEQRAGKYQSFKEVINIYMDKYAKKS